MIIPRRLHIRLSLLLILTVLCQFGLGQSVFARYVWCFGINDHVTMELAGHHHATAFVQTNVYEVAQSSPSQSDCTDIAVPENDSLCNTEPSNDTFKIPLHDLVWIACLFFLIPPLLFKDCWLQRLLLRGFIDSGQLALRCTVLLI